MRVDSAHRRIAALPEEVFRAFQDPGLLAAWLPPEGMHAHLEHFDLRAGGGYRMRTHVRDARCTGQVRREHRRHRHAHRGDDSAPSRSCGRCEFPSDDPAFAGTMFMKWSFESVLSDDPDQTPGSQVHADVGTEVTVEAKDVPSGIDSAEHIAGLQSSLGKLAALFEHRRRH